MTLFGFTPNRRMQKVFKIAIGGIAFTMSVAAFLLYKDTVFDVIQNGGFSIEL